MDQRRVLELDVFHRIALRRLVKTVLSRIHCSIGCRRKQGVGGNLQGTARMGMYAS